MEEAGSACQWARSLTQIELFEPPPIPSAPFVSDTNMLLFPSKMWFLKAESQIYCGP